MPPRTVGRPYAGRRCRLPRLSEEAVALFSLAGALGRGGKMAAVSGVAQSRFVVVGGGIAGVTCAEKVRAVGRLPAGRMRAPRRLAVRVFPAVSAERGPCFICQETICLK